MKKLFIAATLLIGMVAGAMVLSSFVAPKANDKTECSQITMNDGWRRVGVYYGYDRDGKQSAFTFMIWQKEGMCGAYYWTYSLDAKYDPDSAWKVNERFTGELRKNSEGKWYAALDGKNYFIDF